MSTIFQVFLTVSAQKDLEEIFSFLVDNDSKNAAEYVLSSIEKKLETLREFPLRGVYPNELAALGILDYRELFFKPYRIIYKVQDLNVYIILISDGRRDMQTLLQKRILS